MNEPQMKSGSRQHAAFLPTGQNVTQALMSARLAPLVAQPVGQGEWQFYPMCR